MSNAIETGKTYSWTNKNHVNGPTTYFATVIGVNPVAGRVVYRTNGLDGLTTIADFLDRYAPVDGAK